eukprot:gene10378-21649_t
MLPYILSLYIIISLANKSYARSPIIKLAFGVMIYQKKDHTSEQTYNLFQNLMEGIYDPNHIYILHIDIKSEKRLISLILNDYCHPKTNCYEIPPRNIAWGGLSTAEMMLYLMQTAVETGILWDSFVLIGHESIPLTSVEYMEGMIASYPKGTNFLNCWQIDGYNFYSQWESLTQRVQELVIDSFEGYLIDIQRQRRRHVPFKLYKSLQLCVLSYDFIRYVVHGRDTRLLFLYLANVKTADE